MDLMCEVFGEETFVGVARMEHLQFVLDLGANTGYASAYFLSCFPSAQVMAVEPEPGNVEMLRHNLAVYGDRARVVEGAAWPIDTTLYIARGVFGDGREWATQVSTEDIGQGEVRGFSMETLLTTAGVDVVDLLKVNIEGSELQLFSGDMSWLKQVRNICIELHGEDCLVALRNALAPFEYEVETIGMLTFCWNLKARDAKASNPVSDSRAG